MTPEFVIPDLWVQNCGCFILYPIGSSLIEPSFNDDFEKKEKWINVGMNHNFLTQACCDPKIG